MSKLTERQPMTKYVSWLYIITQTLIFTTGLCMSRVQHSDFWSGWFLGILLWEVGFSVVFILLPLKRGK